MDYQSALHQLLSLVDSERVRGTGNHLPRYDLSRMRDFLTSIGSPHLKVPTIHVAGTKGKGSTAAMISSILMAQGYTVGLFTSPHLHTFRERIRLGLSPISKAQFASLMGRLEIAALGLLDEGESTGITTFEMLTTMAFKYFAEREVDFQIMEVGLGGRLDATNVVEHPLVCVITALSLDHTAILGDTLAKIAAEKAGIIKDGSIVVTGPQLPEALEVIQEVCQIRGARLINVTQDYVWEREEMSLSGQSFSLQMNERTWSLWVPLLGRHQLENAVTAIATVQALGLHGVHVSHQSVMEGLTRVQWAGRLEVLRRRPLLVVDGAHNPSSVARLRATVEEDLPYGRITVLFGCSADKDLQGMVKELAGIAPTLLVATQSRHPKARSPRSIAEAFASEGIAVKEIESVAVAVRFALTHPGNQDLILVTGSLFVVAEAIEEVRGIAPELYPEIADNPLRRN